MTDAPKSNITALPGCEIPRPEGTPNETLVIALENLLEKARTGELQSFVGTGFTSDKARMTLMMSDHPSVYEMLGAITWMQREYQDLVEGYYDDHDTYPDD